MNSVFVVDASVAVKLFVPEPDSEKAYLLFGRLGDSQPIQLFAPHLLYVECANTLWKYCQFFGYEQNTAEQNLRDLRDLGLQIFPDEQLLVEAFQIARQYDVSVYDAIYVGLAKLLKCSFVTADKRLLRQLGKTIPYLLLLQDWEPDTDPEDS
ncbi:type II toxin-antitoxin system VapC family toxin [Acidobacteria bacterium AH-259-L09]|nr:type II toxin-antitoxin system VapC family toxin [Acidobacteria bacterium AH-259-L09]